MLAGGEEVPEGHRSGFVCLVGRPNVGKSTLLNAMVGAKVSIVTEVPGTTRNAIRGVVTRADAQLIFIDTPGFTKPRTLLNQRLNDLVRDTWSGVDVICFLVDAAAGIGAGDRWLTDQLRGVATPVVAVVNKEDRVRGAPLIPVLDEVSRLGSWAEIVPTSAVDGTNVAHLADVLVSYLPEGPRLFPAGQVSDQPERQLVAEIIREKFIVRMHDELPHSIAVVVEGIDEDPEREDLLHVSATIFVERDSQKGIVIGRRGAVLARSNTLARQELETILGAKVFLDVRVKVAKDWQRDPRRLERFGY
ncbi:MAG: GTPase Era [Actinobacteria bacterium]|nr:GTPase Era [Actinomycetota bacterium]